MTIKKAVSQDEFIKAAPDAAASAPAHDSSVGVMRGNRRQVTITFAPHVLPLMDAAAEGLGISRAAWVNMVVAKALKAE